MNDLQHQPIKQAFNFTRRSALNRRRSTIMLLVATFFTLVSILSATAQDQRAAQTPAQAVTSPEEVVQQFYRWYLHALNQNKEPGKQQAMLRKWVKRETLLALKKAERAGQLDADWFLDAQDWNADWERNINTSKVTVRATTATLLLTLNGENWTHKLKITLKREDGVWKIANAVSVNP